MSAYTRDSDENKYMSFWIEYDELLEKNNEIWENSEIASKNNLTVNLRRDKSTQIFTIINYQKKVLIYFFINNFNQFCF